mmetsp:Transcript_20084/g.58733  ORF Transcript_20084/g.58733 Transcript_20084/m.58733 type:complete len:211 (+) Transcript_20084:2784-3416(+)
MELTGNPSTTTPTLSDPAARKRTSPWECPLERPGPLPSCTLPPAASLRFLRTTEMSSPLLPRQTVASNMGCRGQKVGIKAPASLSSPGGGEDLSTTGMPGRPSHALHPVRLIKAFPQHPSSPWDQTSEPRRGKTKRHRGRPSSLKKTARTRRRTPSLRSPSWSSSADSSSGNGRRRTRPQPETPSASAMRREAWSWSSTGPQDGKCWCWL